jgi:hypothetical protein
MLKANFTHGCIATTEQSVHKIKLTNSWGFRHNIPSLTQSKHVEAFWLPHKTLTQNLPIFQFYVRYKVYETQDI